MRFAFCSELIAGTLFACALISPRTSLGQEFTPPKTARLCNVEAKDCANLTWAGEYYEGRKDGETKVTSRCWITQWDKDAVEMNGKTAFAVQNGFPLEAFFHGTIAPDGASIQGGTFEWRVGVWSSGTGTWTMTWNKAASNAITGAGAAQFQAPRHSTTNPNILLPPGAAEVYASYPDVVRAILLPEAPLLATDSKLARHEQSITDAATALEIARFAYRAGEMKRGDCWLLAAMGLGSVRAKVIDATIFIHGWQGTPKDPARGFGILKANLGTHDPWDIWILTNCYIDGTGTPKDAHQAAILTSYALTHDDVYDVSQMVGADDAQLVAEFQRLSVYMDPPTTSKTDCNEQKDSSTPSGMRKVCHTTSVVDEKAMDRRLGNINADYQNKVNSKP